MRTLSRIALLILALAAVPVTAQTYTIGKTFCGIYTTSAADCYDLPLTIGSTTTTAWLFMDYPPNRAEDTLTFHSGAGDYAVSNVQVVSRVDFCFSPYNNGQGIRCESLPTEITASLTGFEGTTGSGHLDLKLTYELQKVNRWYWGPVPYSDGGTITIN